VVGGTAASHFTAHRADHNLLVAENVPEGITEAVLLPRWATEELLEQLFKLIVFLLN
jgi:hypothetical protein